MSEIYSKTCFVTGGGTGGHIYPAMAIADILKQDTNVYYVGNANNMEYFLSVEKGYNFLNVNVSGMPRKFTFKFFLWIIKLFLAVIFSLGYIKKYKPDAVFATGGYVSAPMIFACMITKTPYIMHDCDAMPGLVSRHLSKKAHAVSLAFEQAKKYIKNPNIVVTGNPIRKDFAEIKRQDALCTFLLKDKPTLCVMGGSQGATSINSAFVELIKELSQDKDLQIIFQTGKKKYDTVIKKLDLIYRDWQDDKNLVIKPYFTDMVRVLKASDIVVSRAGSLSLSEICASDCAPIIVPYPHAAADHQRINAKNLCEMNACLYIEDKDLEPNILKESILSILDNPDRMKTLKENSSKFAKFDAAEQIVAMIKHLDNKALKTEM